MHGTADHTAGGLTKANLMMHKGRIVSRKAHVASTKAFQHLRATGYAPKKGTFKLFTKKAGLEESSLTPETDAEINLSPEISSIPVSVGSSTPAGSRVQVMHGTADHTAGGLHKSDLMMHKGRIVSRKAHAAGKKAIQRLRAAGYTTKGTFKLFTKKARRKTRKH